MIARGALWNCSVFQKEPESVTDVVKKYMKYVRSLISMDTY